MDETLHEDGTSTEIGIDNAVHHDGSLLATPELWVAVSFLLFLGLLAYLKVPRLITRSLDKRAEDIARQINEARRLREEAEALLVQYQRKQREALGEAAEIVAHAESESKRFAVEAQKALDVSIARREQLAVEKIAQAEASAVKEVRAVAVEVATEAARKVIAETIDSGKANELVDDAIRELPRHLH